MDEKEEIEMSNYRKIIEKQRAYFRQGDTRDVEFRILQLKAMEIWIKENEHKIMKALRKDLHKSPFESYATEIAMVKEEIRFTLKHLRKWVRPQQVPTPVTQFPSRSFICHEPYGAVLIMSPWNYPFMLTIAPLVGAICAGNCCLVKPSAYSPYTSGVIAEMIKELFPPRYVHVIQGGRKENEALLQEQFDYIFFTGSVNVGKYVMEMASKHLTPVSLELGGKSPCIVDDTADIEVAARRIVWGKFLNSGQTCVAPDYLLVHRSVRDKLVECLKKQIRNMYGATPLGSPDYPKIVNAKHFERVLGLVEDEKLLVGGESNKETLQIAPTILGDCDFSDPIMQEEIFGPVLPVVPFENLDEVIERVTERPKPLALYFFSESQENQKRVLKEISFGGGCINDVVVHLATSHMPFGGVGDSGMGGYHGKDSFLTFTHRKSILKKSVKLDIPVRYPPYKGKLGILKKLM